MILLARLVLLGWPVIAGVGLSGLRPERAAAVAIMAGYLFLPDGMEYDLPFVPAYDKDSASIIAALALCAICRQAPGAAPYNPWIPQGWGVRLLMLLFLLSPIATVLANGDSFSVGPRVLQRMSWYDSLATFFNQVIAILPLLIAYRYVNTSERLYGVLTIFVFLGLLYTIPILIEIRMSPQVHRWVYGYTSFSFLQQIRGDGYRPVVFLNHGLWTAIFIAMAATIAAGLWRAADDRRAMWGGIAIWIVLVLLLMKSLGALLLGVVFALIAALGPVASRRWLLIFAASLTLALPMLRSIDLVPTEAIISAVESISEERAGSLQFRFDNEDDLLAHANERALTGWGGWGRNLLYDRRTGDMISTVDGRWVIVFGLYGWIGYVAEFGLICAPLFLAAARARRGEASSLALVAALALGVNLIDLIPNATLTPLTWLLAGAVLGVQRSSQEMTPAAEALSPPRRKTGLKPAIGALDPR